MLAKEISIDTTEEKGRKHLHTQNIF